MAQLLRITQMNAVYFDNEIHKVLNQIMQKCFTYLPPGYTAQYHSELDVALKLIALHYSIGKCDSTFGQKLLSIKYNNLTTPKRVLYFLEIFLKYILDKFQESNNNFFTTYHMHTLTPIVHFCVFLNMSLFLRTGVKPRLIDRILCLDQSYISDVRRQYNIQYLTRELLWDSFIELFVYILPLINYHKVKRVVKYFNPFHEKATPLNIREAILTADVRCPHCNEYPILPYHMGCAHIFCYTCLKGNQLADQRYECPTCEYKNPDNSCKKVS